MQVVLTKDFPQLGQKGIVVNVKPGYFRNFLMTQGVAQIATSADLARFAKRDEERKAKRQEMLAKAKEMQEKMSGQQIKLKAKASKSGSLYAQLHELDVAKALNADFGMATEAADIKLEKAIKKAGEYKFTVRLGGETKLEMSLMVEADAE